jgi:hypothetical protein
MANESRWYGVSHGDGNMGVSQMFPDYYVKTAEPWRLARLAAITIFKPEFQEWASENVDIDGEAEFTISAGFHDMPATIAERAAIQARADAAREAGDETEADRLASEAESYGCDYDELILEIFPCEPESLRHHSPQYDSLADCFGDDCALVAPEAV